MKHYKSLISTIMLSLGALLLISVSAAALPANKTTLSATPQNTPTLESARLSQPPTVTAPDQADNGAQAYWSMCMSCHGDRGQGLTAEWRQTAYEPGLRDCRQSGCHGSDHPANSFEIPASGIPALAGPGTLARFSNVLEMNRHIQENMPFSRSGSISAKQAWALTAYVLRLNNVQTAGLTYSETNSAAFPLHSRVILPENEVPGALLLAGVLGLVVFGLAYQFSREPSGSILKAIRPNFFQHLHPARIPAVQARFLYTLGAGGLAIFLSLILLVTGLLEMFYYIPTPQQAPISVQTITTLVPFGNLIRNLHFWSAQLLLVVATIHLLRVVLTGAYARPRRFNYLIGLGLFILILLLDFSGYMLRWDDGIKWALIVGSNLLKTVPWIGENLYQLVVGGSSPGAATLTRFFFWHVYGLTLAVMIMVGWHAFRVRRDGGIAALPLERPKDRVITRFDLARREILVMAGAGLFLLLFSLLFSAPTGAPFSNTNMLAGDSRAPWFFLWVQYLLPFGDPFILGVMIPVSVFVVLGLLPYVLPNTKSEELGRWFPAGNRIAQVIAVLIMLAILILTILGVFK